MTSLLQFLELPEFCYQIIDSPAEKNKQTRVPQGS